MSDTKYRDRDGNIHDNRSDAEAANAKGPGVAEAGANIMMAIFGPIIALGLIGILIFTFIKQYGFYILPIFGFLFFGNLFLKIFRDKCLIPVSVLLLATVGTILFGKLIYYPYIIEPSTFTADYIVGEAAIHARRNGGGKELAVVTEGEKVTVNGVSRDRKEFNVTAEDGSTGWIPAAAFPEDANFPPDDASDIVLSHIPLIGRNKQTDFARNRLSANSFRQRDRDWLNRMEAVTAYFNFEDRDINLPNTKNANGFDDIWPSIVGRKGLKVSMLNRAVQVNQPFTATINATGFERGGEVEFSGDVEMTLWYVLYAPEATIVSINPGDHGDDQWAADNITSYHAYDDRDFFYSLILKDLDTGVMYPFVDSIEIIDSMSGTAKELIFIFPPVATRHFALVHENPNTDKKDANTAAWDIPEVTIAVNAPTMASDPYVVVQGRIQNYELSGSDDITTRKATLYSNDTSERTEITEIPAGEIVTILRKNRAGGFIVKYKNFEGHIDQLSLKHWKELSGQ